LPGRRFGERDQLAAHRAPERQSGSSDLFESATICSLYISDFFAGIEPLALNAAEQMRVSGLFPPNCNRSFAFI
jgi:hypothetical protein